MTTTPPTTPHAAGTGMPLDPPRKMRRGALERWFAFAGILLMCTGFLIPFAWMISTSLKTIDNTMLSPPQYLPHPVEFHNYADVINSPKIDFPLYTRNTLLIAVLAVIGTTLSSAVVAYGFAKIKFRGRGPLFVVMLSTMMIPFPVIMLPLFIVFRFIDEHTFIQMFGTFKPLWLPAWFGNAFCIFLLRQFFMTIPDDMSEAARIDGCSEWRIFWRIILPLSRPALAVVALLTFMSSWNNFMGPLIFLQNPQQYTLALALQSYQSQQNGTDWNLLMAASALVMMPVLLLFLLTQKTFIEGIATTGIK